MRKYLVEYTRIFRKDYKRIQKRGYNMELLDSVVSRLQEGIPLPEKNRDHALTGDWVGYRECHISPDWLLIYQIFENTLILSMTRTGTHSDLDI